ncbi:MAG: DCC1-like thiol-disulfide oxidoreductase family protein [Cyclobacteriaceae bacterium]
MGANNSIEHPVVFFDGVCNLCNSSVNFIIRRDRKGLFKFSPLQGKYAASALPAELITKERLPSLVLLDKQVKMKSTAVLSIAKRLNGLWPLLYIFIIIPAFLRHLVYDFIAKNRYKWFGKKDHCMIPTPDLKDRFID